MLASSVLEKCIKTLFSTQGWQLKKQISEPSGISGMRQIMFLKSDKTIVLEIMRFCGFLLNIAVLQGII